MEHTRQCGFRGAEGKLCQQILSEKSKFCPTCGTPTKSPKPQKPPAFLYTWPCQSRAEDGTICGGILEVRNKFCGQCGTKVSSPICRHCFESLAMISTFCPSCGKTLMEAVTHEQQLTTHSASSNFNAETSNSQMVSMIQQLEKDEEIARRFQLQEELNIQGTVAQGLSLTSTNDSEDSLALDVDLINLMEKEEMIGKQLWNNLNQGLEGGAGVMTHIEGLDSLTHDVSLITLLENDEQIARQLQEDVDGQDGAALATQSQAEGLDSLTHDADLITLLENDEQIARQLQEDLDRQDGAALAAQSQAEDIEALELSQVFQEESDKEVAEALQEDLYQEVHNLESSYPPYPLQTQDHQTEAPLAGAEGGHTLDEPDENDYEELLALDDELGPEAANQGLSKDQINQMPITPYTISSPKTAKEKQCQICMSNYEPEERLRTLPCFHSFHCDCIDPWIQGNPTCPVCRMDLKV